MRQLIVGDRIVHRESDWNKDGVIDRVRVRLSTGDYWEMSDSDADGVFDHVKKVVSSSREIGK